MDRIGLTVGRFQPLHKGHLKCINHMIQDCETAIICLGSSQKSREEHDPWTVEERMQMLKNIYGDRIKIVPLNDLGATSPQEWTDYIFEKFAKLGLAEPTDYYTGSIQDSFWYKHRFYLEGNSNEVGDSFVTVNCQKRMIHLIDRNTNPVPSATEIRGFLQLRTHGWQQWVPRVNYDLVSSNYPEELKVPKA